MLSRRVLMGAPIRFKRQILREILIERARRRKSRRKIRACTTREGFLFKLAILNCREKGIGNSQIPILSSD